MTTVPSVRPSARCGCAFRLEGDPSIVVIDESECAFPKASAENRQFHAVADNYGEQGVAAWSRQNDEKLKTNFIEGPSCAGCKTPGKPSMVMGRTVYVLAYDYARAHQPRSVEEVPKVLCCVRCGTLRPLPESFKDGAAP